ncbi:Ubiquinone/menaquinone biosynthesis C-methyltransferase UbiE [bioreactor metagenome]|uniref:Ubiquinone/menaquinone biosynthesis C-methyltransferase UbiE n=1 Tax=bioreactor metagenome TaxID=1076179 RepID=A0A644UA53_9ZZZZ|nr:class I SAM-dependent methyltransferase [uncultured Methanobrevibacter sp.]
MDNSKCISKLDSNDWEKAWKDELGEEIKKKKFWTKDTPKINFEKIAIKDEYHDKLIEKLILDENDTVLDLGCGEGAVTTLVAEKVSEVVGLDSSDMMLDLLQQRIDHGNIENIQTKKMKIEDATVDTVGKFDIVLASRSFMGIHDIKNVLINSNEISKKYVFLAVFGRRNWRIEKKFYEKIGKDYPDFAPHDYIFNMLINLGIYPNIEHFDLEGNRKYDDLDDAFIRMKWKNENLTEDEIDKIKPFLKENLTLNKEDGMLENTLDKSDLVLIWWSKDSYNW